MKISKVSKNIESSNSIYGKYEKVAKNIKAAIDCLSEIDETSDVEIEAASNLAVVLMDLQQHNN